MRRSCLAGSVAVAALLAAPAAGAHVTVQPAASRPGELQRYTVYVPNEEDTATTSVALRVPRGVDFLLVEAAPGWKARVVRAGDRVSEVRWTGGDVEPDGYAELHLLVRNPVREGEVTFPTVQRYASGRVARWIGSADAEDPAPRVRLSESATPVDVVSTHGESTPAAPGAPAAARAPAAPAEPGRDGLTLGVAIAALVVALGGAGIAVSGRRRR